MSMNANPFERDTSVGNFLTIWIGTYFFAWPVGLTLYNQILAALLFFIGDTVIVGMVGYALLGAITGTLIGAMQKLMLQTTYHFELPYWIRQTAGLWAFSAALGGLSGVLSGTPSLAAMALATFTLPALWQAWRLRDYLQSARLWILANVVSAIVFLALVGVTAELGLLMLGGVFQGTVTGLSILDIINMANRQLRKQKREQLAQVEQEIPDTAHLEIAENASDAIENGVTEGVQQSTQQ